MIRALLIEILKLQKHFLMLHKSTQERKGIFSKIIRAQCNLEGNSKSYAPIIAKAAQARNAYSKHL